MSMGVAPCMVTSRFSSFLKKKISGALKKGCAEKELTVVLLLSGAVEILWGAKCLRNRSHFCFLFEFGSI